MPYRSTFAAIKGLIQSGKISSCAGATLTIEEPHKQATLKSVHIVSVGADAFSIKFDLCGFPGQAVFNAHPSLHRACDAVAFCEVDGEPYIICCELKSSEPTKPEVAEQFKSAHCFLGYLEILLSEYCNCQSISSWPRRYFVFHGGSKTPVRKQPTRELFDNTSPEKALFIPVQSGHKTYVRKLLGKPV